MAKRRLPKEGTSARYQAENDFQILTRAEEIHASPKRFSDAKKIGINQLEAISKVILNQKNAVKRGIIKKKG